VAVAAGAVPGAEVGGRTAGGVDDGTETPGVAPAVGTAVPPVAGMVGSLIVAVEVGLGGRLIRTVSFFGWTLAASDGLGGGGGGGGVLPGTFGVLSAIKSIVRLNARN
jgi:hypothetical protein